LHGGIPDEAPRHYQRLAGTAILQAVIIRESGFTVIARSEATKQSILPLHGENGLLRFARNDDLPPQ
jgi:hypothetical protein